MTARRLVLMASALLALAGAAGLAWTQRQHSSNRLFATGDVPLEAGATDVVLVTVCTLRKDRLGLYGGPNPTSPFLDELARHGAVFEQHFSQAPWTKPGMAAVFTGRYPRSLHVDNPTTTDRYLERLPDDATLLAEVMKAAGYTTVASVANPNLNSQFGYNQGFDHYTEPEGTYKDRPKIPNSAEVVDGLLETVAQVPADQPVYIRAVVLDGHLPMKFDPEVAERMKGPTERVRTYDAALRQIDDNLQRLFAELQARRGNVLFVVTADHGEGLLLPRFHGKAHGNYLYRTTTETPWLVYHPALSPGRIEQLSMNIDVLPTVAELLGLSVPDQVDGGSFAPTLRGQAQDAVHDVVFAESFFRDRHLSMAYDGRFQLIRTYDDGTVEAPFTDALYAATDRTSRTDIAKARAQEAARLGEVLTAWERAEAAKAEAAPPAQLAEEDASTRQALEELGYLESE